MRNKESSAIGLALFLVLETGSIGVDELALASDQYDGAGKLAIRDLLLEHIMDAAELLLGHSDLFSRDLRQAHAHQCGRSRQPALILRRGPPGRLQEDRRDDD